MRKFYPIPTAALVAVLAVLATFILARCGFNRPAVNEAAFLRPKIDHAKFASNCVSCHEARRPAAIDVTPHGNSQDCADCHRYITEDPLWTSFGQFSHVPAPTACIPCHGSLRPKANPHPDTKADCVGCHAFPRFLPPINQ